MASTLLSTSTLQHGEEAGKAEASFGQRLPRRSVPLTHGRTSSVNSGGVLVAHGVEGTQPQTWRRGIGDAALPAAAGFLDDGEMVGADTHLGWYGLVTAAVGEQLVANPATHSVIVADACLALNGHDFVDKVVVFDDQRADHKVTVAAHILDVAVPLF